jgi:very-short-patch-repair endonuclease
VRGDFKNKCFVTIKDRTRDDVLGEMGLKILKFLDRDVFENMGGVMERK